MRIGIRTLCLALVSIASACERPPSTTPLSESRPSADARSLGQAERAPPVASAAPLESATKPRSNVTLPEYAWQPAVYVTLLFESDETSLRPGHERALDLIASALGERQEVTIALTAPSRGKQSAVRARFANVRKSLIARGVTATRLREIRRDEPYPTVAPIEDDRVEFWVVERSGQKLEPFEPLSVDASRAEQLRPEWSAAVYSFDQRRPGTEAAREWLERTEQGCRACNGDFGPQGRIGAPGCACRTSDAGKPCSTSGECEYRCQLPWPEALRVRELRCRDGRCVDTRGRPVSATIPRGRCAELVTHFGCQGWIVDMPSKEGPTREVRALCKD